MMAKYTIFTKKLEYQGLNILNPNYYNNYLFINLYINCISLYLYFHLRWTKPDDQIMNSVENRLNKEKERSSKKIEVKISLIN